MKIIRVFKTSRGIFRSKEEAEKKKNRSFSRDPRNGTGQKEYEEVDEVFVIAYDDCLGLYLDHPIGKLRYFELKQVDVK